MGRVAAIVAAAIAGIASLPALLGSDAPPPVPPDVGLTPPANSAPLPASGEPPLLSPSSTAKPHPRHHGPGRDSRAHAHPRRANAHPLPEQAHPRREQAHPRPDHRHREEGERGEPSPPAYTPAPAYPNPSSSGSGEFRIER